MSLAKTPSKVYRRKTFYGKNHFNRINSEKQTLVFEGTYLEAMKFVNERRSYEKDQGFDYIIEKEME